MYQILAYVWKRQVERSMPKCPYASMRIKKEVIAMYIIELILKNIYVHIFRHLFSCTKTSQHQQISADINRYQQISTDVNRYQQISTDQAHFLPFASSGRYAESQDSQAAVSSPTEVAEHAETMPELQGFKASWESR